MEQDKRLPLIGMTLDQLTKVAVSGRMPKFVGQQLADWLYRKKATSFDEMVNISKKNKQWLAENYVVGREQPASRQKSSDGTVKYLFNVGNGRDVESVYIPEKDRATLCVSSQVGCKMNCYFCATGRLGFKANLTPAQIINQILSIPPKPAKGETAPAELTNVVFMGMGEPMDNLGPVMKAIEILTAPWGLAWSPKRITVSSIGKLDNLRQLIQKTKVHIAISVHSPFHEEREALMPVERAYPVASVLKAMRDYDFAHQRRLSLEYIMWDGRNDDLRHADALARLVDGLDCRVNLIRFHSFPGFDGKPATQQAMERFRDRLNALGITATIRASRGEDIEAACGMLAGKKSL